MPSTSHLEHTTLADDVVELAPSRLYVAGGRLPLDRRISWAPEADWGAVQPLNCYLLREGTAALVVDPGPGWHRQLVVRQLGSVLSPGSTLSAFVTRAEFDTFSALPALAEAYEVERVHAGGRENPMDFFSYVTKVAPSRRTEQAQLLRSSEIPVEGERSLTIIRPPLRLLATYWAYDALTETLFTSDAFSHMVLRGEDEDRIAVDAAGCDVEQVRDHLYAKFWWLPHATDDVRLVGAGLRTIFEQYPIRTLAPSRGKVIHGHAAVLAHYGLVQEVLDGIARGARPADRSGRT